MEVVLVVEVLVVMVIMMMTLTMLMMMSGGHGDEIGDVGGVVELLEVTVVEELCR